MVTPKSVWHPDLEIGKRMFAANSLQIGIPKLLPGQATQMAVRRFAIEPAGEAGSEGLPAVLLLHGLQ